MASLLVRFLVISAAFIKVSGIVVLPSQEGEEVVHRSTSFTTGSQLLPASSSQVVRSITSGGSGPILFPSGQSQTITRTVISGEPLTTFSTQGQQGSQLLSSGFGTGNGQLGSGQVTTRHRTIYSNGTTFGGLESQFPQLSQFGGGGQTVVRTVIRNITTGGIGGLPTIPGFNGFGQAFGGTQSNQQIFVTNYTSSSGSLIPGQSQQFSYSSGGPITIRNVTRVVRTKKIILNSKGEPIEVDGDGGSSFSFSNTTTLGGAGGQQQFSYSSGGVQFSQQNPSLNVTRIIKTRKIVLNSRGDPIEVNEGDGSNFNFGNFSFGGGLGQNSFTTRNVTRILRTRKIITNSEGQQIEVDGDDDSGFNFGNFTGQLSGQRQSTSLRFPPPQTPVITRNITRIVRTKKIIRNSQGKEVEVDDDENSGIHLGNFSTSGRFSSQQQSYSQGGLRYPPPPNPVSIRNVTRIIRTKKIIRNRQGQQIEVDGDGDIDSDFNIRNFTSMGGFSSEGSGFSFENPTTSRRNITRIIRKKIIRNSQGEQVEVDDDGSDFNFGNSSTTGFSSQSSSLSGGLRFPSPPNPVFTTRNITRIIRRKKVIINNQGQPVEVDYNDDDSDGDFNLINNKFTSGFGQDTTIRRNITRIIRRKKITINSKGEPIEVDDDSDDGFSTGNHTYEDSISGQQGYSFSSGGLRFPPPANPVIRRNITRIIRRKKIVRGSNGETVEVDDDNDDDLNNFNFSNFSSDGQVPGGNFGQRQSSYSAGDLRYPPPGNPTFSRNITRIVRRKKIIINSKGDPAEAEDEDDNGDFGNNTFHREIFRQEQSSSSGGLRFPPPPNPSFTRNITRVIRRKKIIINSRGEPEEIDENDGTDFGNFSYSTGQQQSSYSSGTLSLPSNPTFRRNITRTIRRKKTVLNSKGEQIDVDDDDGDLIFGNSTFDGETSGQQNSLHSGSLRFAQPSSPLITTRNITRIVRRKKVIVNGKGETLEVDDDDHDGSGINSTDYNFGQERQQNSYSSGGLRYPPPMNPSFTRNVTRIIRRRKKIVNSKGEETEVEDDNNDGDSNYGTGFSNEQQQVSLSSGGRTITRNITRVIRRRKKIIVNSKGETVEVDDDDNNDSEFNLGNESFGQQQQSQSSILRHPPPANPSFTRNFTTIIRRRKKVIINSRGEPVEVDDNDDTLATNRNITRIYRTKKITINSQGQQVEVDDDDDPSSNFGNEDTGIGTFGQQQYSSVSGGLRYPPPANPTFRRNITRIVRRKKIIINSKGEPTEVDDDSDGNFVVGNYSGGGVVGQQHHSFFPGGLAVPRLPNSSIRRNITRIIRRKKIILNSKGEKVEVDDDDESSSERGTQSGGVSQQQHVSQSSVIQNHHGMLGNPRFRNITRRVIKRRRKIKGGSKDGVTLNQGSIVFPDEGQIINVNSTYGGQNESGSDFDNYYEESNEDTINSGSHQQDVSTFQSNTNGSLAKRGTDTTYHSKSVGFGDLDFSGSKGATPKPASKGVTNSVGGSAKGGVHPGHKGHSAGPDDHFDLGSGVTANSIHPTSEGTVSKGGGAKGNFIPPPFIPPKGGYVPSVEVTSVKSTTTTTSTTTPTTTTLKTTTRFSEFDDDDFSFDFRPADADDSDEIPRRRAETTQDPDVETFDVDMFGADRNVGDRQKKCDGTALPKALVIFMWLSLLLLGLAPLLLVAYLMWKFGLWKGCCCCKRNPKEQIYSIDRDPLVKGSRNSPQFLKDGRYVQNVCSNNQELKGGFAAAGTKHEATNGSISHPIEDAYVLNKSSNNNETTNAGALSGNNYQDKTAKVILPAAQGSKIATSKALSMSPCPSPRIVKTFKLIETHQQIPPEYDIDSADGTYSPYSGQIESEVQENITGSLLPLDKAKRLSASSERSLQNDYDTLKSGLKQSANTITTITIEKQIIPQQDQSSAPSNLITENLYMGSERNSPNINLSRSDSQSSGILQGKSATTKLITTIIKQASGINDDNHQIDKKSPTSGIKRIKFESDEPVVGDSYISKALDYGDASANNASATNLPYKLVRPGITSESPAYGYQSSPRFRAKNVRYETKEYPGGSSLLNLQKGGNARKVQAGSSGDNKVVLEQPMKFDSRVVSQPQSASSSSMIGMQDGAGGMTRVTTRKIITTNTSQQNPHEDIQIMDEMDDFLKYIDQD